MDEAQWGWLRWENFNLPSGKMTIGDEQADVGYISSAPSNSTNKNEGTK